MSGFSFIRDGLIQKPVGNNMAKKAFQRDSGLKIDGILLPGGETESALLTGLRNANAGVSATAARQDQGKRQPQLWLEEWLVRHGGKILLKLQWII